MHPTQPEATCDLLDLPGITVIVGHAGVGKTTCAIGLALARAAAGRPTTLVDLDIVNPYFRSSDYRATLAEKGVHVCAPVFAGSTLDTPSLTGELDALIERAAGATDDAREALIVDVGGDDDGATTLGRYAPALSAAGACVLYAVSCFRTLSATPADAAAILRDIEHHAHLRASALLNTSNLGSETTADHVRRGIAFATEAARACGLPLAGTAVPRCAIERLASEGPARAEAEALLAHEGACDIDAGTYQQIAATLTDADSSAAPLVMMPTFVGTPWDARD